MKIKVASVYSVLDYYKLIEGKLIKQNINKLDYDILFSGEITYNDTYTEGNLTKIFVNRYERSKAAREECIKRNGYVCKVCEFDFYKVYGEIGENYIHIHHKMPISKIARDYILDVNDLIPVCPNCHAMLHIIIDDNLLTVEQLKNIMENEGINGF